MEVMEKGAVAHSPLFIIRTLGMKIVSSKEKRERRKGNSTLDVRIAAVMPKKTARTAVLRNKMRRLVYEAVQPIINSVAPGTHAVIFAKAEAIKADFKDISADLKALFVKAKISV